MSAAILPRPVLKCLLALVLLGNLPSDRAFSEETGKAGFRSLLAQQQRETFLKVAEYAAQNPQAEDALQAQFWLLENSVVSGLEAEAVPVAEKLLERTDLDQSTRSAAQQVLCLGLVRGGKVSQAVGLFDAYLKGVRFQQPSRTIDFAQALATKARIVGEFGASREIYEKLASAFPLNPQVSEMAESKIAKLDLIGKPAPRIGADDRQGKRVDLDDYTGKVVLVDFWATNCAPCLAEFPNLKQMYQELQPQGFEIIGVSLDEDGQTVDAFCERARLPWRMVMNETPEGEVGKRYKVRTIPALYLVDRQGKVVQLDVRGNDLRTTVEQLLKSDK